MPYRQRNNVCYPASAITLQKQRAKRQAAGYGSGSLDAFTEEERRSVQVAEGVLPDHIRKKMHELLGEGPKDVVVGRKAHCAPRRRPVPRGCLHRIGG